MTELNNSKATKDHNINLLLKILRTLSGSSVIKNYYKLIIAYFVTKFEISKMMRGVRYECKAKTVQ